MQSRYFFMHLVSSVVLSLAGDNDILQQKPSMPKQSELALFPYYIIVYFRDFMIIGNCQILNLKTEQILAQDLAGPNFKCLFPRASVPV